MSLHDNLKKINPVKGREGSQRPSAFNGVKQFIESEKGKDISIIIIVILVGLGSFELGRLSKENSNSGIKMEYRDQNSGLASSPISSLEHSNILQNDKISTSQDKQDKKLIGKNYFASNRGSKYYSLGCSAGKTIKQENRIYFTTGEEAESAGYTLSSSCR